MGRHRGEDTEGKTRGGEDRKMGHWDNRDIEIRGDPGCRDTKGERRIEERADRVTKRKRQCG
jgi:hypothetical protein